MNKWGYELQLDLHNCDANSIRSAEKIRQFTIDLCDAIEMKGFGEPVIVHFGGDERVAGYSLVQLIETSLISAHFRNENNRVYLNVFSCKPYNSETAIEVAIRYFGGHAVQENLTPRD